MVAIAAFFHTIEKMKVEEIVMIGLTAAATFALLDICMHFKCWSHS